MTELADGLDSGVREREEAKAAPGFFTYSVAWGEGVVMMSLRGKTPCKVWEDLYLATQLFSYQSRSHKNLSLMVKILIR